jgi:DNA gyrase/topoisomerase IV subunit B
MKKVTGGRNGYGAKLANIFSKNYKVETADVKVKKYIIFYYLLKKKIRNVLVKEYVGPYRG